MKNHKNGRFLAFALAVPALMLTACFGKQEPEISVKPDAAARIGSEIEIQTKPYFATNVSVHEETFEISGIDREYELVFTADNHISLCDDRDPDLSEKAKTRYESFVSWDNCYADESFENVINYVKNEEPDLLILGGDVIDSAMYASVDFVSSKLSELEEFNIPYIYGMGNHDFEYGYEYYTDKAFNEYMPRLSGITDVEKSFETYELEDLVVMIADDYGNKIAQDSLDELNRICSLGKPVIVSIHVPIEPTDSDSLWEMSKSIWGYTPDGASRVLLGSRSCVPDAVTAEFINKITEENSPVELVLAGHIHFYHKDTIGKDTPQVIAGPGFDKEVSKIILTPKAE